MTNEANENVLRNQADDLILQDLQENAMAVLEQVWRLNPGIASSGFIRNRFQQIKEKLGGVVRCKIALLRSFTIEPIIPLLEAACAVGKIDTEIYIGQYNAYQSEILDTHSALYKFEPNIIILAINIRDLNPLLWSQYTSLSTVEVASYAESIIEGFKSLYPNNPEHGFNEKLDQIYYSSEYLTWQKLMILDESIRRHNEFNSRRYQRRF